MSSPLREGQVVTIYRHPYTERVRQGRAQLGLKLRDEGVYRGRRAERWRMRFLGAPDLFFEAIVLGGPCT